MTDHTIQVIYKWNHPDHDPSNVEEITNTRLPLSVKIWIDEHVNKCMDWKAIKNLLRLDENTLLSVSI
jgi:hypothetical protein